jgi:carbamoyl-phosphate synthase large subunit
MEIVHSPSDLARYMREAFEALEDVESTAILIDEFLRDAIEVDVDCIADGETVVIGGIMQHIEEAGIHSGDSASVLPAHALPPEVLGSIRASTRAMALELGVIGLMNVQYAVRGSAVYVIEVNPRASRTVPFVSKAIGVPLAKLAAKLQAGKTLKELGFTREVIPPHVAVKESVFPFAKFPGVDTLLGPEMRSTGEVMGISSSFAVAFHKAAEGANTRLPQSGLVFISVRDADKQAACEVGRSLVELGFTLVATTGTAQALARSGVSSQRVAKFYEGQPNIVDYLRDGKVAMVINTTEGDKAIRDSYSLRRQALTSAVPYFTTVAGATAAVAAIEASVSGPFEVCSLQEYHAKTKRPTLLPPS